MFNTFLYAVTSFLLVAAFMQITGAFIAWDWFWVEGIPALNGIQRFTLTVFMVIVWPLLAFTMWELDHHKKED